MERWSINDSDKIYNLSNWGATSSPSTRRGISASIRRQLEILHRSARPGRRPDQAQDQAADPAAVHGHPGGAHRIHQPRLQERDQRQRVPGPVPDLLPDQGQPAAPGGRGHRPLRQAYNIGLEVGSKPELWPPSPLPPTRSADHLQRLQGHRVHRDRLVRHQDRLQHHHRRREAVRTGEDHRTLARKTGITPKLGIRVKLSSKGTGKWATSGGEDAKFGCASPRS
jgi:arginine decarboxylase